MGSEQPPDLVTTGEMGRHVVVASEATEIDDLLYPGPPCRVGEVNRSAAVELLEVSGAAHRMDQVAGRVHTLEGGIERATIEDVSLDDLRVRFDSIPQHVRPARQAAQWSGQSFESMQQSAADVAG